MVMVLVDDVEGVVVEVFIGVIGVVIVRSLSYSHTSQLGKDNIYILNEFDPTPSPFGRQKGKYISCSKKRRPSITTFFVTITTMLH